MTTAAGSPKLGWGHQIDDIEPLPEDEMTIPEELAVAIASTAPILRRIINFIGSDALPPAVYMRAYAICKQLSGNPLGELTEEAAALAIGKKGRAAPNKVKRDMQKAFGVKFGAEGDKLQSAKDQCKQSRLNNLL